MLASQRVICLLRLGNSSKVALRCPRIMSVLAEMVLRFSLGDYVDVFFSGVSCFRSLPASLDEALDFVEADSILFCFNSEVSFKFNKS